MGKQARIGQNCNWETGSDTTVSHSKIKRRERRDITHFLTEVFVFLVLSCMSCLYILEINPLSVVPFAIIFSHSEGCLFTLLLVSFAVQKLLSLIRSHLLVLFFFFLFPLL